MTDMLLGLYDRDHRPKRYFDIMPKMQKPEPVKEQKDPEVEAAEVIARIRNGLAGKR